MLKLTATHIEEIRIYFLATSEEEQLTIQKNIIPSYLSGFLPPLKQLFNRGVANEIEFASIAKSMGAEDHLEALKNIQQDYYSQLAEQYNSGVTNQDIEALLKVENVEFLREVDFQKELKTAFQLNERAALKKKFQQLEKETDIDADEMSQAFKLIERQKIKEQFQKFEKENELEAIGMVAEPSLEYSTKKNASTKNGSTNFIKFKCRPVAIAASIVGLIGLAAYIFILAEGKKESNQMAINRNNQIDLFGKDNNLTDSGRVYEIKEQRAIGTNGTFTTDSIKVIVRDVSAMADLINFKISFLINKFDSSAAIEHAAKNKHHDLDSLKSFQEYLYLISGTYSYTAETKTITLNVPANDSLISVYRYPASAKQLNIYIKLNTFFYKIDTTITPMLLKQIKDRSLIEILERI